MSSPDATSAHANPALRLLVFAVGGCMFGLAMGALVPGSMHAAGVPLWLCVPFAGLLLSIALMPFVSAKWWHTHYGDVALALGGAMAGYYLAALGSRGLHQVLHTAHEYYAFIALVGGLYIASGGIVLSIPGRATPLRNTCLLTAGAVLANIVGTTGASVLLIRPFMRLNAGRLRPIHVVMFIFIVSNCGGCLTPIGDPPLYLGYLKGVPFAWTIEHMWPMWLGVNAALLAIFFVIDCRIPKTALAAPISPHPVQPIMIGWAVLGCLLLLVAGALIDPFIAKLGGPLVGFPVGATFQIIVAGVAYSIADPALRRANRFSFEPVREVGLLFVGIFLTMMPALEYLQAHAGQIGLTSHSQFYFATGFLSAMLDNAPTYLSFLQVATAAAGIELSPAGLAQFIATHEGQLTLEAISLASVFFGAMTYIGNGPNFMVKSIVEAAPASDPAGVGAPLRMPSFFAYLLLALGILLPVLVLNWLVFIR